MAAPRTVVQLLKEVIARVDGGETEQTAELLNLLPQLRDALKRDEQENQVAASNTTRTLQTARLEVDTKTVLQLECKIALVSYLSLLLDGREAILEDDEGYEEDEEDEAPPIAMTSMELNGAIELLRGQLDNLLEEVGNKLGNDEATMELCGLVHSLILQGSALEARKFLTLLIGTSPQARAYGTAWPTHIVEELESLCAALRNE